MATKPAIRIATSGGTVTKYVPKPTKTKPAKKGAKRAKRS